MRKLIQLLDEKFSDVRHERTRRNHFSVLRQLQSIVRPLVFRAGAWTPTLWMGNTKVAEAEYTARQGRFWFGVGYVVVMAKIAARADTVASAETVKITDLPFSPTDALDHWPTWISQADPFIYGLLDNDERAIYLNDDRDITNTSWTFSQAVHINVGVVYEVAA